MIRCRRPFPYQNNPCVSLPEKYNGPMASKKRTGRPKKIRGHHANTGISLPPKLLRKAKAHCTRQEITFSAYVAELLRDDLGEEG